MWEGRSVVEHNAEEHIEEVRLDVEKLWEGRTVVERKAEVRLN